MKLPAILFAFISMLALAQSPGFDLLHTEDAVAIDLPNIGVVSLQGVPMQSSTGNADTIIQHLQSVPPGGGTVKVRVFALFMKSRTPVVFNGSPADVYVTVNNSGGLISTSVLPQPDALSPSAGSLVVSGGGKFHFSIAVNADIIFVKAGASVTNSANYLGHQPALSTTLSSPNSTWSSVAPSGYPASSSYPSGGFYPTSISTDHGTVAPAKSSRSGTSPTAMQGVLLGTGFPAPDPERAGPSNAVLVGEKLFIVDTGRGVTMRLAALRRRPSRIDAVFLTHLHSDHTADLPDLFTTTWIMGRSKPLELYGPQGVAEAAAGVRQFLAQDIHIRRDLTEMLPAAGAEINPHVVHPGVVYDDGEVKVIAFAVDHAPVEPAFGYRFESHGRVIVFSGDYHPHEDTVEAVKGADVLVSEVYLPEHFDRVDRPEVAQRLKRYHCTPEQAGELAAKAGVKKLVFTHIIPADAADEIVRRAKKVFAGEVVAGTDLMKF